MPKVPNHLRAHRKRLNLSQEDVAFLMGTVSGAKACRHERFTRSPNLETALAYEVIFQRAICELFGGLYRKIEQEVTSRAEELAAEAANDKGRDGKRRHEVLCAIAEKRPPNLHS
jgi:hypothetical protein